MCTSKYLLAFYCLMCYIILVKNQKSGSGMLQYDGIFSENFRPLKKFKMISRGLRFDDRQTRARKRKTDIFAVIREL